jgi:hypothetical protein
MKALDLYDIAIILALCVLFAMFGVWIALALLNRGGDGGWESNNFNFPKVPRFPKKSVLEGSQ